MKKCLGMLLIPALTAISVDSHAIESAMELRDAAQNLYGNPYLMISGGAGWLDTANKKRDGNELHIKFTNSLYAQAGLGYQSGPMRYMVEYVYARNKHHKFILNGIDFSGTGSTSYQAGLLDFFFLFSDETQFLQPYLGGGIGYAHIDTSGTSVINGTALSTDNDDNKFTWMGALGLNVNIEPRWDIQLEYRHLSTAQASHSIGDHYENDVANLGVLFHF